MEVIKRTDVSEGRAVGLDLTYSATGLRTRYIWFSPLNMASFCRSKEL